MISDTKDRTGHTLRTNPEALAMLREVARLPDLDGLKVVIDAPPKTWVTVVKAAITMSAAAVLALWVGVSAGPSNLDAAREVHATSGGGGKGLMVEGGNGLTGTTYPPTVLPSLAGDFAPRVPAIEPGSPGARRGSPH
jgi:hypothetical protein